MMLKPTVVHVHALLLLSHNLNILLSVTTLGRVDSSYDYILRVASTPGACQEVPMKLINT